jgi:Na+-driven multidrug efflux pump
MVAFKLPIVSINIAAIVGILRASGDTKFPMYVELGTLWLIGVPLAFFAVMVLKVSLPQAYLLAAVEELVKLVLEVKRIKSRNYIKNLTK